MSESKPKNDGGRELEGQLVAGTGTAEGYSREGSDADGRVSHVEDPTRGAKASSLTPPPTSLRALVVIFIRALLASKTCTQLLQYHVAVRRWTVVGTSAVSMKVFFFPCPNNKK